MDHQFSQFSHLSLCVSFWIVSSASSAIMNQCGSSVQSVEPVQPSQPLWIIVDSQFSQFSHLSHCESLWIISSASSANSAISSIVNQCGSSVQSVQPSQPLWIVVDRQFSQLSDLAGHTSLMFLLIYSAKSVKVPVP